MPKTPASKTTSSSSSGVTQSLPLKYWETSISILFGEAKLPSSYYVRVPPNHTMTKMDMYHALMNKQKEVKLAHPRKEHKRLLDYLASFANVEVDNTYGADIHVF